MLQADKRYTLSNIPPIFYIWPSRLVVRGKAGSKFDYGKDRHVIWPKWDPNLITTKSRGGRGGSHVHVWYLCSQLSFTPFSQTGWDLQLKLSLVLGIPTDHRIGSFWYYESYIVKTYVLTGSLVIFIFISDTCACQSSDLFESHSASTNQTTLLSTGI